MQSPASIIFLHTSTTGSSLIGLLVCDKGVISVISISYSRRSLSVSLRPEESPFLDLVAANEHDDLGTASPSHLRNDIKCWPKVNEAIQRVAITPVTVKPFWVVILRRDR
jgi:hypothetical protein